MPFVSYVLSIKVDKPRVKLLKNLKGVAEVEEEIFPRTLFIHTLGIV